MATEKTQMAKVQESYKREFYQRVAIPRNRVTIGSPVFVRKYYHRSDEPGHKLEPLSTGPHTVTEVNEKTCVILRNVNISERISLDRIVLAPEVGTLELRNTVETKWSQLCLKKVWKIHTKTLIVPQDDTTNTQGVVTRETIAPSDSTEDVAEYKIHKIVDQEPQEDEKTLYRIRWYSFGEKDDTIEMIEHLPRGKVIQYHLEKRLKQLHELSNAIVV